MMRVYPNLYQNSNAMKIHLDKDTSIISITITIALLLMLSILKVHAQGQSCNKLILIKKVQNFYDCYDILLKNKYCIPQQDTIKDSLIKKPVHNGSNTMKRIKRGVSYMLISQQSADAKDQPQQAICYLPPNRNLFTDDHGKNI
jgi:hypothetical protein